MHEPPDYECPFCKIVSDTYDGIDTERADIVLRNESVTAFVASHHWSRCKGNVLIITNAHYENLYSLPSSVAVPLQEATQRIALALKSAFGCTGTSTRQHNEPDGGQHAWHYHVHVFPRYEGDNLYRFNKHKSDPIERRELAAQIREACKRPVNPPFPVA